MRFDLWELAVSSWSEVGIPGWLLNPKHFSHGLTNYPQFILNPQFWLWPFIVSSKPIWDIVAHVVSSVPLPSPGKGQILFSVENYLLTVEAPPKDGFPHADVRHQSLLLFISWKAIFVCMSQPIMGTKMKLVGSVGSLTLPWMMLILGECEGQQCGQYYNHHCCIRWDIRWPDIA